MDAVLAVDVGATKFAAGLVNELGVVMTRRQTRADHRAGADVLFDQLARLLRALLGEAPVLGLDVVACGIGSAGPITAAHDGVSPVNLAPWRDFPLRSRVAEVTNLPTALDLDTKALALGEAWVGAATGLSHFVSMVVSTGVGGGIVLDGRLLEGEAGNAGHIGHVIVVPGGRTCGCGATGCLEAEASGTAIEQMTGRPAADANSAIIERTGRLVGRALVTVAHALDLAHAFVGGSVALGFGRPFFTAAQRELDANTRARDLERPQIHPAGLGDQAPLVGAAAVGWQAIGRIDPLAGARRR